MNKTLIAFYHASGNANNAAQELESGGFPSQSIRVLHQGVPDQLRFNTFSEFGISDQRANLYNECVRQGVTMLTVNVQETMVARAIELMLHSGPLTESEREHFFQDAFGKEFEPGKIPPGYGREVIFDLPPGSIIVEPPEPENTDIPPGDPLVEPPEPDQA